MSTRLRRRTLLQGFAAGASACGWGAESASPFDVSFVGQTPERGHLLRTPFEPTATPDETLRVQALIVGAGAAGTAAAWRLHGAGMDDFVIAELEDAPGGTARSGSSPRTRFPLGAHYLPSPHPEFTLLHRVLQEVGVELGVDAAGRPEFDPTVVCRGPVERHRDQGQWSPGVYPQRGESADEAQQWQRWLDHLHELDGRRGADGRRLFALPIEHSSTQLRHLDAISMAAYLDQLKLTSTRLRWTIEYACRDDYGTTLAQTSAFVGLHHFLSRGLEETHDRVTLTWPGGNGELIERLASVAQAGPRTRSGVVVQAIEPNSGTAHALEVATGRRIRIEATSILWAAPRFILGFVLDRDPLPRNALSYTPWLVANVAVSQRPAGIGSSLAWDNVQIGAPHLGYVVATHGESLVDAKTREDSVLTFYEARTADEAELPATRSALLGASAQQLGSEVLAALEGMHPGITPTVRSIELARWGHAMIRPRPGLVFSTTLAQAAAPIGRVIPCATDVGGVPLFEQAFCNGVRAAEQALLAAGHHVDTIVTPHVG